MAKEMISNSEVPPGHTLRVLNYRDRDLIVSAAMEYTKGKDWRDALKVKRLQELLDLGSVSDYFEELQDNYNKKLAAWSEEVNSQQRAGNKSDALPKRPILTEEEQRGKEEKFNIPSKLDAWMQEAVKAWKGWDPRLVGYFAELCGRLGFKDED